MSNSYIVSLWERIFHILRYVSVFEYVRRIKSFRGSYVFVEVWVIGNLIVSLGCIILASNIELPKILAGIVLAYSFIRVLEITVYQVNVLLFDQYKNQTTYEVKGYRRLVILLLHNYIEIIFWFAASYTILSYHLDVFDKQKGIFDTLLFSFITMITFGSNSLKEISSVGHLVIVNQAIVGLFMTMICLARVISLLPKPKTMDNSENEEQLLHVLTEEIKKLEEKVERLTQKIHSEEISVNAFVSTRRKEDE